MHAPTAGLGCCHVPSQRRKSRLPAGGTGIDWPRVSWQFGVPPHVAHTFDHFAVSLRRLPAHTRKYTSCELTILGDAALLVGGGEGHEGRGSSQVGVLSSKHTIELLVVL